MDKEEALEIISMIADGLDPYGEKESSKDPPEINPVTMRAVCSVLVSLLSEKEKEDLRTKYRTKNLKELIESAGGPLELYLKEKGKERIFSALYDAEYNLIRAAEILGITYEELSESINIHQIGQGVRLKILWSNVESDFFKLFMQKHWAKAKTLDLYKETLEKNAIKRALEKTNFSKISAAEKLGITFRSFRYRIDKLGIDTNVPHYTLDDSIKTDFFRYAGDQSFENFLKAVERKVIKMALQKTNNNKNRTAELLGISFRSLRYRIDNLGIQS